MASTSSVERGEVTISPKTVYEIEWKIPDFISLLEKYENYLSPEFSFAGATWRLGFLKVPDYLHAVFIRESTIPPVSLEVCFGFKALNGNKDRKRCAERVTANGFEAYRCLQFLQMTELLERKSDFLPSNVFTMLCMLELKKASEDVGDIAKGTCSHCKDVMDAIAISTHEKKCLNKPIKCPECSIVVILRNLYDHECHLHKTEGDIAKGTCSHCKDVMDAIPISTHEKKCLNKPIKCPECSIVVILRNLYDHECQLAKAEGEPCTSSSNVVQENSVLKDFKNFYLKKENCDVVMRVQGHEFPVHKAILEARSPVLASTFRNNMKEKATGVVDIEDCNRTSFSDFLCFLYCGDHEVISKENVFSLFMAADKYDVQDLRSQSVHFMKDNLSVDTFCETITLALRHSETELIKLTTDFFIANAKEITLTVKWQSFLVENPIAGNELIVKLLASK